MYRVASLALLAVVSMATLAPTTAQGTLRRREGKYHDVRVLQPPGVPPLPGEQEGDIGWGIPLPFWPGWKASMQEHGGDLGILDDPQAPRAAWGGEEDEEEHLVNVPRHMSLGEATGRPADVFLPDGYMEEEKEEKDGEEEKLYPLIMMLHGYGSNSYYHDHFLVRLGGWVGGWVGFGIG